MGWPCKKCGNEETSICRNCEDDVQAKRIAKLEADLNTMSGIMREYAQGFFHVCEMLKAINAKMEATNGQG